MKFVSKKRFFLGVSILTLLIISYFIKVTETGLNYAETDTLLGIIIFHNIFVLSFYLLIVAFLILTSIKRIKFA